MRVLKIDMSFHPIEIIPWEKAFYLICKDKAEVIEWHETRMVKSISRDYKMPSVIKVNMVLDRDKSAKFCRQNVFARDDYTCQYCGCFGSEIELTFDHLTPRAKGGVTSWTNIVTACGPCNRRKGHKTLAEARMSLISIPWTPKWSPRGSLKLNKDDPKNWANYIKY